MNMMRLKLFVAAILTLSICACGDSSGLEKGIEYTYAAPEGTDTATMNDIAATLAARFEAYGLSAEEDFEISTKENDIMIRLKDGADYNLRQAIPAMGNLTFYETYTYDEIIASVLSADSIYSRVTEIPYDSLNHRRGSAISYYWQPTAEQTSGRTYVTEVGLELLTGWTAIAYCRTDDTAAFMAILTHDSTRTCFPRNCEFRWCPVSPTEIKQPTCALIACKTGEGSRLNGGKMTDVNWKKISGMEHEITFTMGAYETASWSRYTKVNVGKAIAIDVDGVVYSYPTIKTQITTGSAQIKGGDEGMMRTLNCVLKGGPLKAPITYVGEVLFGI